MLLVYFLTLFIGSNVVYSHLLDIGVSIGSGLRCQHHASHKWCRTPFPPTCNNPRPQMCKHVCLKPGCECDPGYVLHDGKCIHFKDCPGSEYCSRNETYVYCKVNCPTDYCPKDSNSHAVACDPPKPCLPGCVCNKGYLRQSPEDNNCILATQCPSICKDENATYTDCLSPCPDTCEKFPENCIAKCNGKGCQCKPGYVLQNEKCILPEDCPNKRCEDRNATYTDCLPAFPATCEKTPEACVLMCKGSGCTCYSGYVLHDGSCILPEDCPNKKTCQENAKHTECMTACPATCDNPNPEACIQVCKGEGCQCNEGYVLHEEKCIKLSECPASICKDGNATYTDCLSPCPDTCEKSPENCIAKCNGKGCQCKPGYVLQQEKCILPEDCPNKNICQGNAEHTDCLSACPATCDNPNPGACIRSCKGEGCQCKQGYVLHQGSCITLSQCPGAQSCSSNETYVACKVDCPTGYCPTDNGPYDVVCDPPNPCLPGCACKEGYLRLSTKDNQCILTSECPSICKDGNATYTDCLSPCPDTCEKSPENCIAKCNGKGCQCKPGYVLQNEKCILPEDCPNKRCEDRNATYTDCLPACPATCEKTPEACVLMCKGSGCTCYSGYVLHDGSCILPEDCPNKKICQENAKHTECMTACPATCDNPNPEACIQVCKGEGCQCNDGYVLHEEKCIKLSECPASICKDGNATYTDCLSPCPDTCEKSPENCIAKCNGKGCQCKPGYVLQQEKCILPEDCPNKNICQDNAQHTDCLSACPATCDNPNPGACIRSCKGEGCQCKQGYVLHQGSCITLSQCPGAQSCGSNETYVACKVDCPTGYCPTENSPYEVVCDPPNPCLPGCACKEGYRKLSTKDNQCILASECPSICKDENATYTDCLSPCPDTCEKSPENCIAKCNGKGCQCKPGYVLQHEKCILPEDCPNKRCEDRNATYTDCLPACPATCEKTPEACVLMCKGSGCMCNSGYVLHDESCILPEDCPNKKTCQENAKHTECMTACPATCDNPNPEACIQVCKGEGCQCNEGYVLHEEKCIKLSECPGAEQCSVNQTYVFCKAGCPVNDCPRTDSRFLPLCSLPHPCPPGCICKPNYLKSNDDGRCILKSECPPVECTRPNEVFNSCPSNCLIESCEDIGLRNEQSNCLLSENCSRPRCVCKEHFYRNKTGVCVPVSECPSAQKCGLNEVFSLNRIVCPPQSCESIYTSYLCAQREPNVNEPGCNCIDGYLRNSSGVCIPSDQCPTSPNCDMSNECLPTCANPNPKKCTTKPLVTSPDCGCPDGKILKELGGPCVQIEDCPQELGCNGDPHAIIQRGPWSEPATCDSPHARYDGKTDSVGCVCASGYLLDKIGGECILPDKCPNGDPCGTNATFYDCGFRCPIQYCPESDSRIQIACKPGRPCPPDCVCKYDYRRKSYDDDTCILASECPPVQCTRPNEIWNSCPRCLAERCWDYNQPNICDDLPGTNCQPQCICIESYYRNDFGDCVPLEECPGKKCPIPEDRRPTCAVPNPCCEENTYVENNEDGCRCKSGYVLSDVNGECIRIEDCPTNIGCNEDEHAVITRFPLQYPSTCSSPNAKPCTEDDCSSIGCECALGYILSEINGTCILPDECDGGNPCNKNEVFVSCKYGCPTNNCPVDDGRYLVACDPAFPCPSGCACKLNHLRLSEENPVCIPAYECPAVNCTRPNEVWDSCPSTCLREQCEDVDAADVVCNPLIFLCQPKCVCEKNFYRDSRDICIPAEQCRKINKRKGKDIEYT